MLHNHPFIDGNKRTATVAGISFLAINQIDFTLNVQSLPDAIVIIETGRWNIEQISDWLKTNSQTNSQ